VVRIISPGGGGRGDRWRASRKPYCVTCGPDGFSEAAAKRDYGVALRDGTVVRCDVGLRASPAPRAGFDGGPERAAHEARWDEDAYAALGEALAAVQPSWRAPRRKGSSQPSGQPGPITA